MTESTPQLRAEVIRRRRRLLWMGLAMGFAIIAIAAAPWHARRAGAVIVGEMPAHVDPWSIDVPAAAAMPNAWSAIHPDSRPWPYGMVIGALPYPDAMNLRRTPALDTVLSVLLAPWRLLGA